MYKFSDGHTKKLRNRADFVNTQVQKFGEYWCVNRKTDYLINFVVPAGIYWIKFCMCVVCRLCGTRRHTSEQYKLSLLFSWNDRQREAARNSTVTHPSLFLLSCLNSNHTELPNCYGQTRHVWVRMSVCVGVQRRHFPLNLETKGILMIQLLTEKKGTRKRSTTRPRTKCGSHRFPLWNTPHPFFPLYTIQTTSRNKNQWVQSRLWLTRKNSCGQNEATTSGEHFQSHWLTNDLSTIPTYWNGELLKVEK